MRSFRRVFHATQVPGPIPPGLGTRFAKRDHRLRDHGAYPCHGKGAWSPAFRILDYDIEQVSPGIPVFE